MQGVATLGHLLHFGLKDTLELTTGEFSEFYKIAQKLEK